ncbi:MAG: multicopper oxidase domain-containing protein [Gammaproteobacteria bacterium]|nr:multicopper oxidase domain-containing protein [Gammaproteobacteria bacterium]
MLSLSLLLAGALLSGAAVHAAAPGITGGTATTTGGPVFNLTAQAASLNQPDGNQVYAWGYGCNGAPAGFAPTMPNQTCGTMQVPGPTLIVTEGQTVTVTLLNGLPTAAGNTSILFPDFQVTATGGVTGLMTNEATPTATPTNTVTYSFVASTPGTHAYYSGTQGDLQIEMGLYGAIIVLPATVPTACTSGVHASNVLAQSSASAAHPGVTETDFRLAASAYDHPASCYDREYLFQFAEMDLNIHRTAQAQAALKAGCAAGAIGCSLEVPTEPYHPNYFVVNGRSMPDDMDPNYDAVYPHQPYNGNPHMHPGEDTLIRVIGQGRWQHPFHEHGNHVRILGRDGNLITSATDPSSLAGPLLFTTTTTPGQAFDGIFYWTGRGLNWDAYGHNPNSPKVNGVFVDPAADPPCTPDANGYNTGAPLAVNYFEWCQDHNKPLQAAPFGDVPSGGPATLPDANIFTNGAWYSGSPYLGPDATNRATGPNSVFQPSNVQGNPANERGYAFMWHSHNEREITTNNVFPGGMFMMMLVDSREFVIDESN